MENYSQADDQQLVIAIQEGSKEAENELYRRHDVLEKVRKMVRARVFSASRDREDLMGEVLLGLVKNIRRGLYDPQKATLPAYIYGTVRNTVRDYLRKHPQRSRIQSLGTELAQSENQETDFEEMRIAFRRLFRKLGPRYQQVVIMRYYQDYSIEEIAGELDIGVDQVYNRIGYAIRQLRDEVKKLNQKIPPNDR